MTDMPDEDLPETPGSRRRAAEFVAVALARMEAKLDVAIAQHDGRLIEHDRRISALEQTDAGHDTRIGALEQKHAAAEAREAAQTAAQPPRVGPVGWVSLAISALLALYVILDHTPGATP